MLYPINDKYSVSKEGIVYRQWKHQGLKAIEPVIRSGIPKVSIYRKYEFVAELVLKYTAGREVSYDEKIVYKDGNALNCSLDNLEIVKKPKPGDECTVDGVRAKMITPNYAVTINGDVYSYLKNEYLQKFLNDRGYMIVNIQGTHKRVHRLVAEAFIPNPENKDSVDHINENKLDNRIENLRWATRKENIAYYNDVKKSREYKLLQERFEKAVEQEKKTINKMKELTRANKELEKEKKQLERRAKKLEKQIEILQTLVAYKEQNDAMNRTIGKGLKGFTGIPKAISINGIIYSSIYEAARYIVNEEVKNGNPKRIDTIRKELRRFVNGERPVWSMYGKYKIEAP